MILFYAYTPYCLINCIHIKLSLYRNVKSILILINPHETSLEEHVPNIKKSKIFDEIYILKSTLKRSKNLIKYVWLYLKYFFEVTRNNQIINKLLLKKEISDIYTYGSSPEIYMIYDRIVKAGYTVKMNYYEEGSGSYVRKPNNALNKYLKFLLLEFMHISFPEKVDSLWLYEPSCYQSEVICKIQALPKLDKKIYTNILNRIFNVSFQRDETKIILFDGMEGEEADKIAEIFDEIKGEEVSIKVHPRLVGKREYKGIKRYEYNGVPWEIVCLNICIEDKVLVSYYSTTQLTPKLVFDMEPYVVFLFEMEELRMWYHQIITDEIIKNIDSLKSIYRNKERIILPSNLNELKRALNRLRNRK